MLIDDEDQASLYLDGELIAKTSSTVPGTVYFSVQSHETSFTGEAEVTEVRIIGDKGAPLQPRNLVGPSPGRPYAACTSGTPCGQCEGVCTQDRDCKPGFRCKLRDGTQAVPGCAIGGDYDLEGKGFCYKEFPKENYPVGTLSSKLQGEVCQGPCFSSSDCLPGLACFIQGSQPLDVPYCHTDATIPMYNYCYDPTVANVGDGVRNPETKFRMCEGDCEHDSDCAEGLRCYQRGGGTSPVPGCSFPAIGWDYCYKGNPQLRYGGDDWCTKSDPCPICGGDCDSDEDCRGSLKCLQREEVEPVRGCESSGGGDKFGMDYCYEAPDSPLEASACDVLSSDAHPCCRLSDRLEQATCLEENAYNIKTTGKCEYNLNGNECQMIAMSTASATVSEPPTPMAGYPQGCSQYLGDGNKRFYYSSLHTGDCSKDNVCYCRKGPPLAKDPSAFPPSTFAK